MKETANNLRKLATAAQAREAANARRRANTELRRSQLWEEIYALALRGEKGIIFENLCIEDARNFAREGFSWHETFTRTAKNSEYKKLRSKIQVSLNGALVQLASAEIEYRLQRQRGGNNTDGLKEWFLVNHVLVVRMGLGHWIDSESGEVTASNDSEFNDLWEEVQNRKDRSAQASDKNTLNVLIRRIIDCKKSRCNDFSDAARRVSELRSEIELKKFRLNKLKVEQLAGHPDNIYRIDSFFWVEDPGADEGSSTENFSYSAVFWLASEEGRLAVKELNNLLKKLARKGICAAQFSVVNGKIYFDNSGGGGKYIAPFPSKFDLGVFGKIGGFKVKGHVGKGACVTLSWD